MQSGPVVKEYNRHADDDVARLQFRDRVHNTLQTVGHSNSQVITKLIRQGCNHVLYPISVPW